MRARSAGDEQRHAAVIDAVRKALSALALHGRTQKTPEQPAAGVVKYYPFTIGELAASEESEPHQVLLPVDDDAPGSDDLLQYIAKEMEYCQTFLIAARLGRELGTSDLLPTNISISDHVGYILTTLGRDVDKGTRTDDLNYEPLPHLPVSLETPFVDFAGFLAVLLMDFLQWKGKGTDPLSAAVVAELDTAIEFLVRENTYIGDDSQGAWGFIPKEKCGTNRMMPTLAHHRHALPTAWAVVALERYCRENYASREMTERIASLLPRVLAWVSDRRTEDGLFYSSIAQKTPDLAGHNYITECLLILAQAGIKGAEELAIQAVERFVDSVGRGEEARGRFEVNITYPLVTLDRPFIHYTDHTTWATCLSTLSFGVAFLAERAMEAQTDLLAKARSYCRSMARHILDERRNEAGLWQSQWFTFHWTWAAVEALLRFSRFATADRIESSVDSVSRAVDMVLKNRSFKVALRRAMVDAMATVSRDEAVYGNDQFEEEGTASE